MHCSALGFPVIHQLLSLVKLMSIDLVMPSNHLILCHPLLLPSIFPSIRVFSNVSSSHQVAKVLELQHQSSNEHSGLISFRTDQFDLLAASDSQESSPTPQFKSISSLALSFPYSTSLTSTCDCWKNHSFDYMDLCQQSNSASSGSVFQRPIHYNLRSPLCPHPTLF